MSVYYAASHAAATSNTNNPQSKQSFHEDVSVSLDEGKKRRRPRGRGWILAALLVFFVFFTPFRTTILVMGIDARPDEGWVGRTDTMIITTVPAVLPQVKMLSIPRDLWVTIPGHPDNRINTAHFFAEAAKAGSGPQAAAQAVEMNFNIKVPYTLRMRFDGFRDIVDAMGGVDITLSEPMSGLDAGKHHFDGTQALAFVRDRETSDDFFRQKRGQMFIAAAFKKMISPLNWGKIPAVWKAVSNTIQTDVPVYLYPRLAYSLVFSAIKGFDSQSVTRDMITPFVTDQGAQVLLPNWELINPLVKSMFH